MSDFSYLLRDTGLTSQKIADVLGISRARAVRWLWDRDVPTSQIIRNVILWKIQDYRYKYLCP